MKQTIKNTQRYNFLSAFFALALWGSWSFYVNNQQAGIEAGFISGIAQGVCSFLITLFMTFLIEKQFNWYKSNFAKFILPPIITVVFTGSCLITVHSLIHTPDIIKTVSPALTVALLFAFFTNIKLYKQMPTH
ncbi:hypothetical protein [Acinetobacter rudis]|uniref:EamA-like transporter family protein n=1 Tax=Acinetobacter rudis TaxID=632955 RepID=A0AAW8J5Z6_9GAMM|nr:hypothetical protein [Acinetobacter rudis]MDQ8935150.1 hypothetical protein [Acinetobacter rudis]MDQ8953013.1 hypothetical protein [Acinetobacter rudis]MDQ9017018.1 hypothetical protein [Acinetobacter rudis]